MPDPRSTDPSIQVANVVSQLASAWRLLDAEELALRSLRAAPTSDSLNYAHAFGLLKQGRAEESVDHLKRSLTRHPLEPNLTILHAFALNYDPRASADDLAAAHWRVGVSFRRLLGPPIRLEPARRAHGRPVRVGFVSADLYRHSVSYFLEPLLANLPRERIEVEMLSSSRAQDAVTQRLRMHASAWHDWSDLSHDDFAEAARSRVLDVVVDLSGLTASHRLRALATRLAPVQVSYLGYPHGCGLDTVTTRLADDITDPPTEPNRMAETIVRLPGCFVCYQPPEDAPAIRDRRAPESSVVFGSFGNLAKINRPLIEAWARVLDRVPGARLLVKNHALADSRLKESLPSRWRAWGLDMSRVDLVVPPPAEREHLDAYNEIDIALDTFPYNGTTTTCEALFMGVPVVAFAGDRHASRVGMSLLAAAGFAGWCATDVDDFVEKASALGREGLRDVAMRQRAREQLLGSTLCDGRRLGLAFATAMETLA